MRRSSILRRGRRQTKPRLLVHMKVAAIIQARMGSSRLPGKVLMPLAGKPAIDHVFQRTSLIRGVDLIMVATSTSPLDDPLAARCRELGAHVYRGSEIDVLDRYYKAAQAIGAQIVMRITADCPLLDPIESAKVLDAFLATPRCDYASNVEPPFLPDGLDTEVASFPALEKVWRDVFDPVFREHVTYYIGCHPNEFKTAAVTSDLDLSHYRWTLDEPADYVLLSKIAERLKERNQFGYLDEVLDIVREDPSLVALNKHIERNEGLKRSLEQPRST